MDNEIEPSEVVEFGLNGASKGISGTRFFDENQTHPHATSDYKPHSDFDWIGLSIALGEAQKKSGPDFPKMADGLIILLQWAINGNGRGFAIKTNRPDDPLAALGRRVVALLWALNPAIFEGESLRGLENRLCLKRGSLSRFTADARRAFKLKNRAHGHGWNFKPKETPENN